MDTQFAMKPGEAWLLSEVTLGLVRAQHTPAQHCLDAPVNRRGCAAVKNFTDQKTETWRSSVIQGEMVRSPEQSGGGTKQSVISEGPGRPLK